MDRETMLFRLNECVLESKFHADMLSKLMARMAHLHDLMAALGQEGN